MSYKSLTHIVLYGLILCSCVAQTSKSKLGTLQGSIGMFEGNCMPSPGVDPCEAVPISTVIYISEPSENFQSNLVKDSIKTNKNGEFNLNLAPGKYSLFIKDGTEIICDQYMCDDECFCTLFEIVADSTTTISANIDHASW